MRKFLVSIFIYFLNFTGVFASGYGFDNSSEDWGLWGSGIGEYNSQFGNEKLGSIYLSTGFGEEHTLYKEFTNLKPGYYTVEFAIRGIDLAENSVWSFYNIGKGTETAYEGFKGDFSWKKVKFSVEVDNSKTFEFWLRLRGVGQLWFDDFRISKTKLPLPKTNITRILQKRTRKSFYAKFPSKYICKREGTYLKKKHKFCPVCGSGLLENQYVNDSHNMVEIFQGNKELNSHIFYEIFKDKLNQIKWHKYNHIELVVENDDESAKEFSVVFTDNKTVNYWSRLNFISTLGKGKNKVNFDLTRFVGERGSVRYRRKINLKKLKKFFLIVDHDKKSTHKGKVRLRSIKLRLEKYPKRPRNILSFDFTSHKKRITNGFIPVTTQHLYHKKRGFGFKNTKFWRVTDSVYAPKVERNSIGVLDGEFIVDLPNGEYEGRILIDHLGYWDVPFWNQRKVSVNDRPIIFEQNISANEFLNRILMFESFEPRIGSSMYQSYMKKVLKPVNFLVKVKDGKLRFKLNGTETGVQLNTLYIWPKKLSLKAQEYLEKIEKFKETEFSQIARSIINEKKINSHFGVIKNNLHLYPIGNEIASKELNIRLADNETSFNIIQLPSSSKEEEYEIKIHATEEQRKLLDIKIRPIRYLLASDNANHETYKIVGKYLDRNKKTVKSLPYMVRYVALKIQTKKSDESINLNSHITFKNGSEVYKLPFTVKNLNYELPKVIMPVGFLGLSPFPKTYFQSKLLSEFSQKLRIEAIEQLGKRGFTTFSGLPSFADSQMTYKYLEEIFMASRKFNFSNTIFTYGGSFLNSSPVVEGKNTISSNTLKKMLARSTWPKIIHAFSDEAAGYSNVVERDLKRAKALKDKYPFLEIGAFSHYNKNLSDFNLSFDYGIYSSISDFSELNKTSQTWGMYNLSSAYFEDPRMIFSKSLYLLEKKGLHFYLDWHLNADQNYPYYDLDGREGDIAMLYPRKNGSLAPAVKLELATEGLNLYRKIKLIEYSVKEGVGNAKALKKASSWLNKFRKSKLNLHQKTSLADFTDLKKQIDLQLSEIYP